MTEFNVVKFGEYEWTSYGKILVAFTRDLIGGGTSFGQGLVPFVKDNFGKVDHVFEWCAGPGFIGFSLLAHSLCNSLTLADKEQTAVAAAMASVHVNGLTRAVSVYRSDCLDDIPSRESWDLVVANPPHSQVDKVMPDLPSRIYFDRDWSVHHRFYSQVSRFLRPEASVLIVEDARYSNPSDFKPMIEQAGLKWVDSFDAKPMIEQAGVQWADGSNAAENYYFVWSKLAG